MPLARHSELHSELRNGSKEREGFRDGSGPSTRPRTDGLVLKGRVGRGGDWWAGPLGMATGEVTTWDADPEEHVSGMAKTANFHPDAKHATEYFWW